MPQAGLNRAPHRFDGVRWVFLDVGGVLVDESRAADDRLRRLVIALRAAGRPVTRADVIRQFGRAWRTGAARPFVEAASRLSGSGARGREIWKATPYPYHLDRMVAGAVPVVRALTRAGFKVGILANQSKACRGKLRRRGILRYVSCAIISAEVRMEKPDPRMFRLALRRAKCRPDEAVMVGDRIDNDIRPANRLGWRTIRIRVPWGGLQKIRIPSDRPGATVRDLRGILRPLGIPAR